MSEAGSGSAPVLHRLRASTGEWAGSARQTPHYIHTHLRVSRRVHVRPPRNLFPLLDAPAHLLVAAGIGITPMLAMARHLAAASAQ